MIPQSFIQDLLNRVDIVDVVGRHVQLKKGGANLMGLCPFHNEKSPSFTVSPTKQFYHCFGCGAHGSAIGFLMEHAGLSYVESIKDLAQSVGLTVPDEPGNNQRRDGPDSATLIALMERAGRFYRDTLKTAPDAINYLKGRGLTGEIARTFGIGYVPDDWNSLQAEFPGEYGGKVMLDTGLVIDSDKGSRYDRFRGRVMFPIRSTRGAVIGFGGRVIGAGEPKYLNSPETPLFEKGRELYGLFEARQAIRAAGKVLVVEGYMDVVALAQMGVGYAVATLGTACTPAHVQKLIKQADRIVFSFDGDAAGRRAAWRALENSLALTEDDKVFSFLFLPAEHDPDSYIREHGREEFESLVDGAMPLSRFLVRELEAQCDLSSAEGRAGLVSAAKPHLQRISARGLRLAIVQDIAALAGMTPAEVERLCDLKAQASNQRAARQRDARAPVLPLDEQMLRLLVRDPQLALSAVLEEQRHAIPEGLAVLAVIDAIHAADSVPSSPVLVEHFAGTEVEPFLRKALVEELEVDKDAEIVAAEFKHVLKMFRDQWRRRRTAQIIAEEMGNPASKEELAELIAEESAARVVPAP
jgi:DNA primase